MEIDRFPSYWKILQHTLIRKPVLLNSPLTVVFA